MTILDVHNHFYPASYLDAVRRGNSRILMTEDDEGNPVLHYPGDYNVVVPGHRDIAYRRGVMERADVRQLLTFTSPGTHVEEAAVSVPMARAVNDAFAEIVATHEGRFLALGTLPLNDVAASADELERVMDELGLPGVMVFSNVNGTALADARFWPLWQRASDRGAVVYIHPIDPVGVSAMTEYWLMPLVGFCMDTTLAAAHLVFAGVPARFPGVKWMLGHLGGAIPYLAERLDRGFEAFADCRRHIDRPPSTFLREFYYDTVNFDAAALRLAIGFAGIDHIVAGSDYPHKIGSIEKMRASLEGLDLSATDRAKILHSNAERLLGLV